MNIIPTLFATIQLLIFMIIGGVQGACDICTNNVACHSSKVYSLCINAIPTQNYIICPEGMFCTNDPHICYVDIKPSCARPAMPQDTRCGICNEPAKKFACINETTIAFCFGKTEPYNDIVAHCPAGTFCDLDNPKDFCTDASNGTPSCQPAAIVITTEDPTTTTEETSSSTTMKAPTTTSTSSTAETTTTTEKTTIEPSTLSTAKTTTTTEAASTTTTENPLTIAAFCKDKEPNTIHRYLFDNTCKKFIYCYKRSGQMTGYEQTCADGEYFDPVSLYCDQNKPEECD